MMLGEKRKIGQQEERTKISHWEELRNKMAKIRRNKEQDAGGDKEGRTV